MSMMEKFLVKLISIYYPIKREVYDFEHYNLIILPKKAENNG